MTNKSLTSFVCVIAIVIAAIAYVLFPYKHLIKYTLTQEIDLISECPALKTAPKLQFSDVKNCEDVDPENEPCLVRKAISQSKIDKFVKENGHQYFLVKDEPGQELLGNPLSEARFMNLDDENRNLESHMCTFNDFIAHKPECMNTYAGFKSLNYSDFEHLQDDILLNLEDFSRTDIFLGHPSDDKVTASFHSNNFEKSSTLQLVGEKIWLMMPRESFFDRFGAVAIGAYNAITNPCTEDLAQVPLQAVRTGPGDILRFPKAYPHHIYSLKGPNIMVNFRNFELNPFNPRDVIAMITQVLVVKPNMLFETCPDMFEENNQPPAPTSYGQGKADANAFLKGMIGDMDMRCASTANGQILKYKHRMVKSAMNRNWDRDMFDQVVAYVGAGAGTGGGDKE